MKRWAVALVCASAVALSACGNDGRLEVTPPARVSPAPTATSIPADQ